MRGHQCPKALSLYTHRRELMAPPSDAQKALSKTGNRVGRLARKLFPGGVDLRPETERDFRDSLARTAAAVKNGATVLYEAAFVHDNVLAAVDILVRDGDGWRAYEVKATSQVKPQHVDDAALQYQVLIGAGLSVLDISIVHINSEYVRRGEIDVAALFSTVSVHTDVRDALGDVTARISALKTVLRSPVEPVVAIGSHCTKPNRCAFMAHCHRDVEPSAPRPRHIDRNALKHYLGALQYPLYFMDFETLASPVPLFDGTRPYSQVPFQFSLHRQDAPGGAVTHTPFLAEGGDDPRVPFVTALLTAIGSAGDILTYYRPFEVARLNELATQLPAYRQALDSLVGRCKDLIDPFRNGWYYEPAMGSSNSIKSVLPALTDHDGYNQLRVNNGEVASRLFLELHQGRHKGDVSVLRADLLKYCALDTMAMVRILDVLRKAAAGSDPSTSESESSFNKNK